MKSKKMEDAYRNGRVESQLIAKSSRLEMREDAIELDDGSEKLYHVVSHPGASAILPIDGEGNILLVKQYRYPVDQILLEIPAGLIENGEDPMVCAQRELREEVGVDAHVIEPLFDIYTAPGFTDEKIYLFVAKELFPSPLQAEDSDEIDVVKVSREEAMKLIKSKNIVDAKTIIALYSYI